VYDSFCLYFIDTQTYTKFDLSFKNRRLYVLIHSILVIGFERERMGFVNSKFPPLN
jgi:hypothetical protein